MINGTPKIMPLAIDLHKNFVQMPPPVRICTHPADPVSPDLSSKHRAKSIPTVPNRFVANVDAALVQQVHDVSERKWKANVHHDRQANDLRAAVKILEGVRLAHAEALRDHPARLNRYPSHNALQGLRLSGLWCCILDCGRQTHWHIRHGIVHFRMRQRFFQSFNRPLDYHRLR